MWKDYSWSYLKNNRASSVSVIAAAFISALLLSLLVGLFYNLWIYDVRQIEREEGGWHCRIEGKLSEDDMTKISEYANVERAVINQELSKGAERVADVYFRRMRTAFADGKQIASLLGYEQEAVTYHYSLLSMYLIRDASDPAPRAVFPLMLGITFLACLSLIMIIHNSFAVSMNARIHQFGILSSIGATPAQIRICLLQEAAALCALPVAAGNLLGIAVGKLMIEGTNHILRDAPGREDASWEYHPLLFVVSFLITVVTIWVSAWIPARKMSRRTPLEAIKNTGELQLKKKKNSRLLRLLFGVEGELAGNALKAQKKNLRTATWSLLLSFSAFFLMQSFFTLTGISQQMTYFERYQNNWDVMMTLKNTEIDAFTLSGQLQKPAEAESCIVYQKAQACRILKEEELSREMKASGSMLRAPQEQVSVGKEGWMVSAPLVILDDESFLEYCKQVGAEPRLSGAVILNRHNSNSGPNFRVSSYIPYLDENVKTSVLRQAGKEESSVEIPVLSYAQQAPVLREDYDDLDRYVLVHFLPVSLWREIRGQIKGEEPDTYIRLLAGNRESLEELNRLEEKMGQIVGTEYEAVSENRIQDKITNDEMIRGMMLISGSFCVLLAMIGIGSVFSNTFGFAAQRRREFARYFSIGLTPGGIVKVFCVEALAMAGGPLFLSLVFTALATTVMIRASYLEPAVFLRRAPVLPMLAFALTALGFVALAYFLGGRKVLKSGLSDALRDDTMV